MTLRLQSSVESKGIYCFLASCAAVRKMLVLCPGPLSRGQNLENSLLAFGLWSEVHCGIIEQPSYYFLQRFSSAAPASEFPTAFSHPLPGCPKKGLQRE